jgi:hypothetical protein
MTREPSSRTATWLKPSPLDENGNRWARSPGRRVVASVTTPSRSRLSGPDDPANTIDPSLNHVAPPGDGTSARSRISPSASAICRSLPPAKNDTAPPPRFQAGYAAPSVPVSGRASSAASARSQSIAPLAVVATKTIFCSSGEMAASRRSSPAPRSAPAGVGNVRRMGGNAAGGSSLRSPKVAQAVAARAATARMIATRLARISCSRSTATVRRRSSSRCRSRSRRAPGRAGRRRSFPSSQRTDNRPAVRRRRRCWRCCRRAPLSGTAWRRRRCW